MPPNTPKPPAGAKFYQKVSSADPLAGPPKNDQKAYAPPPGKFDFILNSRQKGGSRLAFLSNMPRAALIAIVIVLILFGLYFVSSSLSSGKKAWVAKVTDLMAQDQEIIRVSTVARGLLQDSSTLNLDATTLATLTSDQAQLNAYLKSQHVKVNTKKLNTYLKKSTDASLKAAAQNNSADATYSTYISQKLAAYQKALTAAFKEVGPNGKQLLSNSYDSAGLLLNHFTTTSS